MTLGLLDDSSEPDPRPTELTGGTFLARADSSGRECWRETVRHPFLRLKLIDPSAYTDLDPSKPLIAEPAFDQGEHCEQLGSPDLLERHPPPAVVAIGDYLRPTADSLRKDKAELCTRHTHLEPPRHKAPSPSRVDPDATGTRWQRPLETYPLPGVQAQVLSSAVAQPANSSGASPAQQVAGDDLAALTRCVLHSARRRDRDELRSRSPPSKERLATWLPDGRSVWSRVRDVSFGMLEAAAGHSGLRIPSRSYASRR